MASIGQYDRDNMLKAMKEHARGHIAKHAMNVEIYLKNGRFGPYLQYEMTEVDLSTKKKKKKTTDNKFKNVSIPKGIEIDQVDLEKAKLTDTLGLRSLGLGFNDINADGITAIVKALTPNHLIQTLSIRGNIINAQVVKDIGEMLRLDHGLTHVHLEHLLNCAGEGGERYLAAAIASNSKCKLKSITGFARNVMGIRSDPPTIKIVPNFAKVGSFTDNRPPLR